MSFRSAALFFVASAAAAMAVAQGVSTGSSNVVSQDRKRDFVVLSPDGGSHSFGQWDWDEVKALKEKTETDRIVVRQDGKLYEVTDRATLANALKLIQPIVELGRRQGELGKRQGELGKEQGALGRKQGELGKRQGELAREMEEAARQMRDPATRERAATRQAALRAEMSDLSERMQDLGRQQSELGRRQGELGQQQGELGRQQGAASRAANVGIDKLIDDAFAKGLAREVR